MIGVSLVDVVELDCGVSCTKGRLMQTSMSGEVVEVHVDLSEDDNTDEDG